MISGKSLTSTSSQYPCGVAHRTLGLTTGFRGSYLRCFTGWFDPRSSSFTFTLNVRSAISPLSVGRFERMTVPLRIVTVSPGWMAIAAFEQSPWKRFFTGSNYTFARSWFERIRWLWRARL